MNCNHLLPPLSLSLCMHLCEVGMFSHSNCVHILVAKMTGFLFYVSGCGCLGAFYQLLVAEYIPF